MLFLIKRSHFQEYRQKNFEKSIVIEKKNITFAVDLEVP